MVVGKIVIKKNFARLRIRNPKQFQSGSFRTIDPGRPGHIKVIVGRLKGKTTTTAQAVIAPRKEAHLLKNINVDKYTKTDGTFVRGHSRRLRGIMDGKR